MTLSISPEKLEKISGQSFNPEQKSYLTGFLSGLQAKGVTFGDIEPTPSATAPNLEALIFEERVKKEEHPLDSYYRLLEHAAADQAPDKEHTFRFKWQGLFYLSPVKDAYMARLRIPGGMLTTYQWREIARTAQELTSGYIQITTRANVQVRLIKPKQAPEFLRRIQSVGLHSRGSGADNVRNLTANPTAGIDPYEHIDVMPYVREVGDFIISHREFYDLPRKFNIAFDGGGLIGSVEDTNDIGISAAVIGGNDLGLTPGVYFRIKLGGATGHKAFARDLGVLVAPEDIVNVTMALLRVYLANGNRGDRKKARLKHLLESWSLEKYLEETEKLLGKKLTRSPLDENGKFKFDASMPLKELPHSHIGVYPQKQDGLFYIGVALPVGQITASQMQRLADLADHYGTGEIRLTVWQNLLLPNIPASYVETVKRDLVRIGLGWKQSNITSGLISCTGNKYCKFSSTDTKGHALALGKYLEKKLELDLPINIHFTGCPNSCAQHYMGDIGLLGTKAKVGGESVEGYHIFVGGGFAKNQALGRQVFNAIAAEEMPRLIEKMIRGYLRHRQSGESFQHFTVRHEINDLQGLFSNDE